MIAAGGGRVCAIRFITASHPDQAGWGSPIIRPAGLLVDPRVREGFARLAPRGLSFDAWMYHTQLGDLVDLAGAFRRNWPRPGDPISRVASPPSAPRAMFESNFPVDKGSCSFAALWNVFKCIAAGCFTAEKAVLLVGTRSKFYRLE